MPTTNAQSGTNVEEIADRIYRINTPLSEQVVPGGFSFNQYLILDEEPLLFHTGPRKLFPLVREAVAAVIPVGRLRYVGLSHVEADECGQVAAMVSMGDLADRPPRAVADGETISLGTHRVRWFDTPHLPHAWECGFLLEESTRTLLCGDLFTQPGSGRQPLTETDILGPSEDFRQQMDYFSHSKNAPALIERLAATHPRTLGCMHGSAWRGDGAALLRALAVSIVR